MEGTTYGIKIWYRTSGYRLWTDRMVYSHEVTRDEEGRISGVTFQPADGLPATLEVNDYADIIVIEVIHKEQVSEGEVRRQARKSGKKLGKCVAEIESTGNRCRKNATVDVGSLGAFCRTHDDPTNYYNSDDAIQEWARLLLDQGSSRKDVFDKYTEIFIISHAFTTGEIMRMNKAVEAVFPDAA